MISKMMHEKVVHQYLKHEEELEQVVMVGPVQKLDKLHIQMSAIKGTILGKINMKRA